MINKVVFNGNEVTGIKYGTFHYNSSAGTRGTLAIGGVYAAYIEFEYFASNGVVLSSGDVIEYYQTLDVDRDFSPTTPYDLLINYFNVVEVQKRSDTYYVLAYDDVIKLNIDYSARLKEIESQFPMTIKDFLDDVVSYTGVNSTIASVAPIPEAMSFFYTTINYFYASGITARDIFGYISELRWHYVMCVASNGASTIGGGTFHPEQSGWRATQNYIVCPDDGTYYNGVYLAKNVWYKENGLEYSEEYQIYDGIEIYSTSGNLLGKYYSVTPPTNIYTVRGNLILDNINTFDDTEPGYGYDSIAQSFYSRFMWFDYYRNVTAKLFTFRMPYKNAGLVAYGVDADGTHFKFPIVSLDLSSTQCVISSFGEKIAESGSGNTSNQDSVSSVENALWSNINQLESKVDNIGIQIDEILDEKSIPTTATSYDCDWGHYDALVICAMFYSNVMATIFIPTSYFRATTTTLRPIVYDPVNSRRYDVYRADNDSVYLVGFSTPGAAYGVRIYGVSSRKDIASVEYLTTADGDYLTTVDGDYLTL